MYREKVQRTTDDIIIILTDEEEYFRKKFITEKLASDEWKCTICAKITKDKPYPHPALRVSICFDCLNSYENAVFLTNKDGTDKNCRWCTKQAKKYNCSSCTVVFCKDCIERNIDSNFVRNRVVNSSDWNCFICDPKPLWRLRVVCIQTIESTKCCSAEEIETIEIMSQEDRLSFSQQAFPNSETHTEQFSSEMISPKKVPKPIVESDDDSLFRTQVMNNNNKEPNIEEQISADEKKSLSVVLQETEKDFLNFVAVFSKRIDQFSEKCKNINSYERAEKLVNKVNLLCDNAIENFQSFQNDTQKRFEVWSNSIKIAKTQIATNKEVTKVCDNVTPPRSKSPSKPKPKNSKSVKTEVKVKIEVPNKPSTSKHNKNTSKRKYSLSLKTPTPPKEPEFYTSPNEEEDTLDFIERMKHKLPDDEISPKKNQLLLLSQSDKIPIIQNATENQAIKNESTNENPKVSKKKPTNKNSKSTPETQTDKEKSTGNNSTPIKTKSSNTASTDSSQNNSSPNLSKCSQISSVPSLEIKSEPVNDTRSEGSNETIIRASSFPIKEEQTTEENCDPFDRQTLNGEEDLQARIRTDFDEDQANDITVSIENYLCEKTGEFCQSYRTGLYNVEDEDENSKEECNFDFSNGEDTDKTEDYDWNAEFEESTKEKDVNSDETDDKQSEAVTQESSSETEQESDKSKAKDEEQSQENKPSVAEKSENEDENINYSEAETIISDTEYDREAAFRALKSSDSELSCDSETESKDTDTDSEKQSPELKVTYGTGYVRQLDIAAEIAKLHENNRATVSDENDQDSASEAVASESDSDSDHESLPDPKLRTMKPIVMLNRDEIETKINNLHKRSTDEDSDIEHRRLIDLSSLKKRNIISSDSDSDVSESRKRRKKKKLKKSSKGSRAPSSDTDSDTSKSIKSEAVSNDFTFDLSDKDKDPDYMPRIDEDLLNDTASEAMSEDDDVIFEPQENKEKDAEILITDEDEPEKTIKEDDPKSKWRKDKLLTDKLVLSNSDTDVTNDSTANEILQKQEEKYLKNVDKDKPGRKRSVEITNSEDEAIVLSTTDTDDTNSNDSDIQIVELKRKRETDDEESQGNKKGRRNIREVLKDNELREETKKADKLEAQRKERLSQKQKTLDTILSNSQLSQEEVGFVLDVDEEKKEPLVTVHHTLVPRLKEHQKKGIKFMWDGCFESVAELKRSKGTGCILAHCMGLGKTMQVVVLAHTLLTHEVTNVKHVLVICPLSTVFNWRNEFEQTLKVCPEKISIFDIRPDRQKNFNQKMFEVRRWRSKGGVLMLGYESFQSLVNDEKLNKIQESYKKDMLESLIDPGADLIVCDEGHMLKNGKTLRFTSLSKILTDRRIILTGTPLQNNLIEYYYMVNFVKPHLLGTLEEYKNRFVNPISNGQYEDSNREDISLMKKRSHILHKKLETTVQRYEEAELAPYLPDKFDYVLSTQLTPLQIKLYEHYLQLLDVTTKKLFKNYHALQNIWTHPALLKIKFDKRKQPKKKQKLYDEDFVAPDFDPDNEDIAGLETEWFKDLLPEDILTNISYGVKMEILFSIIKECGAVQDKLLVFSSSIDELDLIENFLNQIEGETWIKGVDYYRMDGTVVPEKRMKYCNEFNNQSNKRARVFLVSHKVGGLGLNLTAANRVVLMDVSWNPAYDIQSVFRIYRFGQTKTCFIYRFVSMGTMEEVVYSRAVTKLAVSCRVVDEHQIKRHFNSDDLQRMYRLIKDFGEPPALAVPSDRLLAKLWETHKPQLYKFCDHQSLLENLAHEELNEEEMKLAWDEFRHEVDREKDAKEMANNRYANYVAQQSLPPNSSSPYPIMIPNTPAIRPLDFQPGNYQQQADNSRYKRPNKLPTSQELINRAYYLNRNVGYVPHPSHQNQVTPSTSTNASNVNSTPSTSSYIPLATTTINTNFPAVSTSVNQNFNATNGGRYWHKAPNIPTNKNWSKIKNPVIIQVPNSQIYPGNVGSKNGVTTIRNNGNKTYGNQISNSNVPTGIVNAKFVPSGQKENVQIQDVERSTIENLNKNGVSLFPKNDASSSKKIDAQPDLTSLLNNYLIN